MKQRFAWRRIPDYSDPGILPAAYIREKLGSVYETLASLNQASDAIGNLTFFLKNNFWFLSNTHKLELRFSPC